MSFDAGLIISLVDTHGGLHDVYFANTEDRVMPLLFTGGSPSLVVLPC